MTGLSVFGCLFCSSLGYLIGYAGSAWGLKLDLSYCWGFEFWGIWLVNGYTYPLLESWTYFYYDVVADAPIPFVYPTEDSFCSSLNPVPLVLGPPLLTTGPFPPLDWGF
jgi:hypothetical protein